MPKKKNKNRVAILASGSGTTAEALIRAMHDGKLVGVPELLIASQDNIGALNKASNLGVTTHVLDPRNYLSPDKFASDLLQLLLEYEIDYISQNGWLVLTPPEVIYAYLNRILNQHPGPLDPGRPDFGGKGMYGSRVTCARLAFLSLVQVHTRELTADDYFTEAVVHYTTPEYDQGDLIKVSKLSLESVWPLTRLPELLENPSLLSEVTTQVQTALLPVEHQNSIRGMHLLISGQAKPYIRKTPLIKPAWLEFIEPARHIAFKIFKRG